MTNTDSAAAPLSQPLYGASLGAAFSRFWRKYATFSGRASRSEFWWWFLVSLIVSIIFNIIGSAAGGVYTGISATGQLEYGPGYGIYATLAGIWGVATIIPNLALYWRRLHDTNHSGGYFFFFFIPIVGWIFVLVWLLSGPKPEGARFDR